MRKPYDIVLFGATGFTGGLVADYLARTADPGVTWAIAGRDQAKLEAVRDRLGRTDLPLLRADVSDPESIREMAGSARVVMTTVGPYVAYGEPVVAACAASGTDYVDLTGEAEFVDRMYLQYHEQAVQTGARLVHACGFDSIPHDLGAYYTVQRLPEGEPLTVEGFVRVAATVSGGTFHSALSILSRARAAAEAAMERRRTEPSPKGRRVRAPLGPPRFAPNLGGWVLPMPTIDPQIVRQSAAALERYGPDFTYRHNLVIKRLPAAAGLVAGMGALTAAAQVPPVRSYLMERLRPGEGPSAERRARSWFKVRFLGEGGGRRVITEVAGGDPGYDETAKMLAESALCLAFDDLPVTSGQVTTAAAMGDALIVRLTRAGIRFRVIGERPANGRAKRADGQG